MTTARDVIADILADYYYGEVERETVEKDAEHLLTELAAAPDSVRQELAALLMPPASVQTEKP